MTHLLVALFLGVVILEPVFVGMLLGMTLRRVNKHVLSICSVIVHLVIMIPYAGMANKEMIEGAGERGLAVTFILNGYLIQSLITYGLAFIGVKVGRRISKVLRSEY